MVAQAKSIKSSSQKITSPKSTTRTNRTQTNQAFKVGDRVSSKETTYTHLGTITSIEQDGKVSIQFDGEAKSFGGYDPEGFEHFNGRFKLGDRVVSDLNQYDNPDWKFLSSLVRRGIVIDYCALPVERQVYRFSIEVEVLYDDGATGYAQEDSLNLTDAPLPDRLILSRVMLDFGFKVEMHSFVDLEPTQSTHPDWQIYLSEHGDWVGLSYDNQAWFQDSNDPLEKEVIIQRMNALIPQIEEEFLQAKGRLTIFQELESKPTLPTLEAEIDQIFAQAEQAESVAVEAGRSAVQLYKELGDRLAIARPLFSYGKWLPWLKERGIPERKAQRAIAISNEWEEITKSDTVTDLSLADVFRLLNKKAKILTPTELESQPSPTGTQSREQALEEVAELVQVQPVPTHPPAPFLLPPPESPEAAMLDIQSKQESSPTLEDVAAPIQSTPTDPLSSEQNKQLAIAALERCNDQEIAELFERFYGDDLDAAISILAPHYGPTVVAKSAMERCGVRALQVIAVWVSGEIKLKRGNRSNERATAD